MSSWSINCFKIKYFKSLITWPGTILLRTLRNLRLALILLFVLSRREMCVPYTVRYTYFHGCWGRDEGKLNKVRLICAEKAIRISQRVVQALSLMTTWFIIAEVNKLLFGQTQWVNSCIFGLPFVKRFARCYGTVVCPVYLSETLAYCCPTVGWIKMPLGTQVGLRPGDIVLRGDPAPSREGHSTLPASRSMPIVAKHSPISATAELLFPAICVHDEILKPTELLSWLDFINSKHFGKMFRQLESRGSQSNSFQCVFDCCWR